MMTTIVNESIRKFISRDRYVSIITYIDGTAQISIEGVGMTQVLHISKEDVVVFVNALGGVMNA